MIRCGFLVVMLCAVVAGCQKSPTQVDASAGKVIFDERCAACHGPGGDVRQAVQYDAETPDLRKIAEQSAGGRMPRVMLAEIIDGRRIVQAHGSRTMPVWGNELSGDDGDDSKEKIEALVAYIESIQTK